VVLKTPVVTDDVPDGHEVAVFGLGCFWGAEEIFWQVPGVWSTSVGYAGGHTPHPTYDEVCSGRTGHTEAVRIVFDPAVTSFADLVRKFFEIHDPTQGMQQGNDVGTQYRSAIYFTSPEQEATARELTKVYGEELARRRLGSITTEIRPATDAGYFYAEDQHQQYLAKNPFGYRCHANTGVRFPADA
jgi:peptide-methionine (S)-S-oxide reductase